MEQREGKYGEQREGRKLVGAVIEFRAVPGLTAEWLQRRVECHIARSAALGQDQPAMKLCPLAVKGVSARVASGGNTFFVEVAADDSSGAEEVWRRARGLPRSAR